MNFKELREANLSKAQINKVHDKADDLPKSDFIKRYGKEGDAVRFATATNIVKKQLGIESLDKEDEKSVGRVIKQLKKAVKAHQGQVDTLAKDIKDEVEITEAISDAQVAQIARMTDRNDHFGVRIEIARLMKDKQLMSFYDSLEKMHMTSQIQNAIGNDAVSLRGKLEKVLKVRMKQRFGDKDSKRIMDAL